MQDAFFANVGRDLVGFPYQDVLYIAANGNYCNVFEVNGKQTCVYHTLSAIEAALPPHLFFRVHRSYIISLTKIKRVRHDLVSVNEAEVPLNPESRKLLQMQLNVVGANCTDNEACSKNKKELIS